jgi:hypothetical protein
MRLHLDSSLGGVLRTSVVLAVMLVGGWRALLSRRRARESIEPALASGKEVV